MAQKTQNRADELRRDVAERNVAAILEATLSQLEHNPRPSLVEIAKAAGVSRPTLYSHFPTREDLVEAAVRSTLVQVERDLAAADTESGTPVEALERLITAAWRSLARQLRVARLALDLLPPERLRKAHEQGLDPLRRLILRGQKTGEFRDDQSVEWMVTVLYALLHGAAEDVMSGRLEESVAAELIRGSTVGAFKRA
jgi:AcrR family transcriptional regulator